MQISIVDDVRDLVENYGLDPTRAVLVMTVCRAAQMALQAETQARRDAGESLADVSAYREARSGHLLDWVRRNLGVPA